MSHYPDAVAKIVADYLERLKIQLRLVPAPDQRELMLEIESHVYESYRQTPGADDVTRILTVLRNLGEPAEVVADRLPGAMVRSGAQRSQPLFILSGILIALFGLPLGFGGMAVLVGVLLSLTGFVLAYYATAASLLLTSTLLMAIGLSRIYKPQWWDQLVAAGVIQMDRDAADLLSQMDPAAQGLMLLVLSAVFAASAVAMFWAGRYLVRGLRFLFTLAVEWLRKFAQGVRRRLARHGAIPVPPGEPTAAAAR